LLFSRLAVVRPRRSRPSGIEAVGVYESGTGYRDTTFHDGKTFQVKFWGSENNTEEAVQQNAMYRAAEFTTEKGGDYFTIIGDSGIMVSRGKMQQFTTVGSNKYDAQGKVQPDFVTREIFAPVRSITFTIGKGAVPEQQRSYIAKDVLTQYAATIKRPG
jgi:hypothetical protein